MSDLAFTPINRRVLVIDDNPDIHRDISKILAPEIAPGLEDPPSRFGPFGDAAASRRPPPASRYELSHAHQGEEGIALARAAADAAAPFALAIVDCRMPPGLDGVQTIAQLWAHCPDLQVVLCTAYSDYSCEDITRALGDTESLMVLKKPFDVLELQQLAGALTCRWARNARARARLEDLSRQAEAESRARLEHDRQLGEQMRQAELALGKLQGAARLLALTLAASSRLAARRDASQRTATLRRLSDMLRQHSAQLGAFGAKLPAFLVRLAEECAAEDAALAREIADVHGHLERLRAALPSGAGTAEPISAA